MARRYLPVNQVVDGVKGWSVLVQVVERGHVLLSKQNNPVNYRRFLFTDSEGTKVSAVIYGNDVRYFAAMLMPFKRYYISSAYLRKQDPRYRVSDYQYSWVIHNRTLVEEYVEQIPPPLPCHFDFQNFKNLFNFAHTENLQNVLGAVVHVLPSKEQGLGSITRDTVIVNEEKRPMLLTLWNEFEANEGAQLANTIANGNIIVAMRVKVTTFNYLSMTTRLPSSIMLNPPIPQAILLKQWCDENKQEIASLVEKTCYKDSQKLLPPPDDINIMSVKNAVSTLKNIKTAWIRGNATLGAGQKSFWYSACMNCQKSVDAPLEWVMKCPSCKEESGVKARCRFGIVIDDGTSSIHAVVFGMDAEKLIPFNGVQLSEADEHGIELFSELASAIYNRQLVCFVRHFDSEYQGQKDDKYNIVKLYTAEELSLIQLANIDEAPTDPISDPALTMLLTDKSPDIVTKSESVRSAQDTPIEKQFFSPTTKMVLESIGEKSDATQNPCSTNLMAKRSLTFDSTSVDINMPAAEKTTNELLPPTTDKDIGEEHKQVPPKSPEMSPLKKKREV